VSLTPNTREKFNEIRAALYQWLTDIADVPVVIAEESDPRPSGPHLAFTILTTLVRVGGLDEHLPKTATREYTIRSQRTFTVSITAAGTPVGNFDDLDAKVRAVDLLNEVQLSLERPTVMEPLRAIGLSIFEQGQVISLPAEQETETEPRAVLDIIFGVCIEVTDEPGYIEKVQVSGQIDTDKDGSLDLDIPEFEVS